MTHEMSPEWEATRISDRGKARQLFGHDLDALLNELTLALAA
ncbi:hypothetical protein [Candidatus Poriferisodalis sp.]